MALDVTDQAWDYYQGKTPATIERVYYAVPTEYTIGTEFDTLRAAVEYARSLISENRYPGQRPRRQPRSESERRRIYMDGDTLVVRSRAFVHRREVVRWADGSQEDRVAESVEVYLPLPEKAGM
jgi:hypothetical protein